MYALTETVLISIMIMPCNSKELLFLEYYPRAYFCVNYTNIYLK